MHVVMNIQRNCMKTSGWANSWEKREHIQKTSNTLLIQLKSGRHASLIGGSFLVSQKGKSAFIVEWNRSY